MMHSSRTLAPLAALGLAIRNVAARMMADADPTGYDHATLGLAPAPSGIDTAPDAYTAIGPDGFGLYGAHGTPAFRSSDELTGSDGFVTGGELAGVGYSAHDAEAELDLASAPEVEAWEGALRSSRGSYVSGCEGLSDTTELSDSHSHATPADRRAFQAERQALRARIREALAARNDGAAEALEAELADMTEGHSGRVGHERDAHVAAEVERLAAEAVPVRGSDGQLTELARMRTERFGRLWAYIARHESMARNPRLPSVKRNVAARKVDAARAGVKARYSASVAQCRKATGSAAPWAGLYLTRLQAETLGAVPAYTRGFGWGEMLGRSIAVAGLLSAVNARPIG